MKALLTSVLMGGLLLAQPLRAQSLEQRVLEAPARIVRMTFPAREGVCGDGSRGSVRSRGSRAGQDWMCDDGPVRVQLEKDGARIVRLDSYVGGTWQAREDVTDLGDVPAHEASDLLLDLAATATPSVAADAITPAVIARAPDPWERLLELARNRSLHDDVREQAIFWVGQSAGREATAGLADIVADDETTEIQKAAVFALSRRDDPERISRLIRVARKHANPEVVRATLFWLAESEDDLAIDLFEEILTDVASPEL